ncbi:MAG: hypothetical protein Q8P48_06515 [Deltaproteobacteria bacterium]|nr:hypothetical protein [Deltaproteobacteria bacterium]
MKRLSRILQVLVAFSFITSAANAEDTIRTSIPGNGAFRLAEFEGGSTSLELYERMSRLCGENNGKAVYVIPKEIGRYKRLVEASAKEAFDYISSRPRSDIAWYMACSGNVRFMVEKMLRSMNRGEDTAAFYLNRGLEGVSYIKDAATVSYANSAVVEKTPEQKEAFREQMAWEVSTVKRDFVKPEDTSRYIGFYNGNYENTSCSRVSIKEMPREENAAIVVYDFKVCDRKVASLGQRVIENNGTENMYANFLARP